MSKRFQQPSGACYGSAALRVVKVILAARAIEQSDAQPAGGGPDLTSQWARPWRGVVGLAGKPGTDRVQHGGGVPYRASHRAIYRCACPALRYQRSLTHSASGWLESDEPAFARRDPDGSAAIVGMCD